MEAIARGELARLFRWPVKSMAGEEIPATRVAAHAWPGTEPMPSSTDARAAGRIFARGVPGVLRWAAAYPDHPGDALDAADPPPPLVSAPDGQRLRFDDPRLPAALSADLERPITLRRLPSGEHDRRGTVLVTFESTRQAVEARLGLPLELRRFRPNLHLALDAPAFAEEGWAGRRIEVGEVILRVVEPCERCAVPTRDPAQPRERWPGLLRWLFAEREGRSARSPRWSARGGSRAATAREWSVESSIRLRGQGSPTQLGPRLSSSGSSSRELISSL